MALLLNLPAANAVGLVIMGCSAGGPVSNFFTYFGRGDLALSVVGDRCSKRAAGDRYYHDQLPR